MAIQTASVVAGTSATLLFRSTNEGNEDGVITFTTHGNSADVYVGGSNVTPSSNGIVIPKSTTFQIVVPCGETLYCAGNGTDTVKYLAFVK